MDILAIGAVLLVLMLVLLSGGVWIAMTLAIVGWVGQAFFTSSPPGLNLFSAFWESNASWELAALPLFIWMGEILFRTKLSEQMFQGLAPWLNGLPGECQCCAQGKDARRAQRDPDLARCCAIAKCCQSYPSPRTIKDLRTVLRSALSSAMSEELIDKNVAALVKSPKQRKRKVVPWSSARMYFFVMTGPAPALLH